MWGLLPDFGWFILFEAGKYEKAKAFLRGLLHGMTGKMGPMEASRKIIGNRSA